MGQSQNTLPRQTHSVAVTRLPGNFTIPVSYNIAYSYRTDKPDPLIVNIPQNIENLRTSNPDEYIRQTVYLINSNSKNDFEKVKKAHDLVALVLSYDAESYWAKTTPNQGYQNVLKTGLSVCAGYANVFKRFCDELKIPCIVVSGYARSVGVSPTAVDKPNKPNHAWNIVTINGVNYFVECTWDSGYMEGKISKKRYQTDYLFIKPKYLIYSHFPTNASHQLLASPMSEAQFSVLPPLKPKFFYLVDNPSISLRKKINVSNKMAFEYTLKDGYYLFYTINEMKNDKEIKLENRIFVQSKGSRHIAHFSFPSAGQYKINIFWREINASEGFGCGEFIIKATSANKQEFPITNYNSTAKNLEIKSPIEMPLRRRRSYSFRIKVENKNRAAIIHGNTFIQLTKKTDGTFYKDFLIPNNISELLLGIADAGKNSYEIIARYRVE
ncbi:MAG: hypothetical protein FWC97_12685 [Treponema sp.]|nr:hypothetical protein [Treponema sp.]